MGKVGSRSVVSTLNSNGDYHLIHIHALSDSILEGGEVAKRSRLWGRDLVSRSIGLRNYIKLSSKFRRHKIISLVREPISRNISSFFQNLNLFFSTEELDLINANSMPFSKISSVFDNRFDFERPFYWFDEEFKGVLDFDIYSREFDKDLGYSIYSQGNFDFLVIKLEMLDSCMQEALSRFLNINDVKLKHDNIGGDKAYSECYKVFKDKYRLSSDSLDMIFKKKYCMHFYTSSEIDSFRKKWAI